MVRSCEVYILIQNLGRCNQFVMGCKDLEHRDPRPGDSEDQTQNRSNTVQNQYFQAELILEYNQMKGSRQHKPQHTTHTTTNKGQEICKIRHQKNHRGHHKYHQQQAVPRIAKQALPHLVHRVHHQGKGEEQVDAQTNLHQNADPPCSEVGADYVIGFFSKSKITKNSKCPIDDRDECHGIAQNSPKIFLLFCL
ncbi:hypothetical protein SLA2020_019540 [Shorea laevis]